MMMVLETNLVNCCGITGEYVSIVEQFGGVRIARTTVLKAGV